MRHFEWGRACCCCRLVSFVFVIILYQIMRLAGWVCFAVDTNPHVEEQQPAARPIDAQALIVLFLSLHLE